MLINTLENSLNRRLVSAHPVGMCVNANMSNATIYNHDCWLCCFPAWKWMTWQMDPSMCSQRAASPGISQHPVSSIQYPPYSIQHPTSQGFQGSHEAADHCSVTVRLQWGSNERLLF